jgi:biopolymer transport protein TolR
MSQQKKKEVDTEINLIPFISLLSVLICSLLLTAIWIQIGSMDVKQAVGGQPASETKKTPSVWSHLYADGTIEMKLLDAPRVKRTLKRVRIQGIDKAPDTEGIKAHIEALKAAIPSLRTVLIQPKPETTYDHLIVVMDNLKQAGMVDLGVAPL